MPHPVLAKIAADTLAAVERGSCTDPDGNTHTIVDLSKTPAATDYYAPESALSSWATSFPPSESSANAPVTQFVLLKSSTLEGVQHCVSLAQGRKIGVLNFASATRPGGGFISGARAQEESIARSSNLYSSLMTPTGQRFYALHKSGDEKKNKYYTHAMIYTRGVQLFRNDDGEWVAPTTVDVLTSAAVNAGVVRSREGEADDEERKTEGGIKAYFKPVANASSSSASSPPRAPTKDVEKAIEDVMRERMGRLLRLFENEGTQDLVLGSFGTGVFRNKVPMVAKLWVELLVAPEARFKKSFRRVAFAIIDEKTCVVFREVFTELGVDFAEGGT
ncbi:hypothetical protein K438DRAFT_1868513 [Mycena galopus ATCC 62051]|nr:hypothetical protein K438DRAFT_1868513 [Mycena galopus ATCC 62051]